MKRIRRCDDQCHNAHGPRCKCWCGGTFHGTNGSYARAAVAYGYEDPTKHPGFEVEKTIYVGTARE